MRFLLPLLVIASLAVAADDAAVWIVPEGKRVATVPAWARGDWRVDGMAQWTIGKATASVDGQAPLHFLAVVDGGDWIALYFQTMQGPAAVLRRTDAGLTFGAIDFPDRLPPRVSAWHAVAAK